MGSFDTVRFRCPACGTRIEHQTKVADCMLYVYPEGAVPVLIASSIAGSREQCSACQAEWKIEAMLPPVTRCYLVSASQKKYSAVVKPVPLVSLPALATDDRRLETQYRVQFTAKDEQAAEDAALDEFHRTVAVSCLDDFRFEVSEIKCLEEPEDGDEDD